MSKYIKVSSFQKEPNVPVVPLSNINIPTVKQGDIYWLQVNTPITITADVSLPDGEFIVMCQELTDMEVAKDSYRFKASVVNGKLSLSIVFAKSGNYVFSEARLNRGLSRINAGFHLSFKDIEFDAYV